jgi:ABC-type sulfate transport system permease component
MDIISNIVLPWSWFFNKDVEGEQLGGAASVTGLITSIIAIIAGLFASFLCWRCNSHNDLGLKVIYTIIAFFNAIPYLIYYLVVRILLGAKCGFIPK